MKVFLVTLTCRYSGVWCGTEVFSSREKAESWKQDLKLFERDIEEKEIDGILCNQEPNG